MALDATQYAIIILLGINIGILYGIRRIYVLENKIERLEEKISKKR
ncbi:MAG: hypothetical protein AB1571_00750 [Nanoarchaeota archaeon]